MASFMRGLLQQARHGGWSGGTSPRQGELNAIALRGPRPNCPSSRRRSAHRRGAEHSHGLLSGARGALRPAGDGAQPWNCGASPWAVERWARAHVCERRPRRRHACRGRGAGAVVSACYAHLRMARETYPEVTTMRGGQAGNSPRQLLGFLTIWIRRRQALALRRTSHLRRYQQDAGGERLSRRRRRSAAA